MNQCKIVLYTAEWRDKLRVYMRKTFPEYSSAYIEFCLDHSADREPTRIVVNSNNEIVGCHHYYCTKAMVNGDEIETEWGHDTFLDKEYRAEMGLDFMLHLKKIKSFGLGMTDVNTKIEKLLKKVFLGAVYNYYTINSKVLLTPFQKLFKTQPLIYNGDTLVVRGKIFKRIHNAKEIIIPDGGFWYKGVNDIDFCRDVEFLDMRFLRNEVHPYYMYAYEENGSTSYFIVRRSLYRGFNALTISDFRYNPNDTKSISLVMEAVKKFAQKSNMGIVFFVCGDVNVEKYFKNKLHHKTPILFDTGMKLQPTDKFSVTGGDSDADFLKP